MKQFLLAVGVLFAAVCGHAVDRVYYETVRSGVIFNAEVGAYHPSVIKTSNGELLVQFLSSTDGVPDGSVYLIRSADNGVTWRLPAERVLEHPSYTTIGALVTSDNLIQTTSGTIIIPIGKIEQIHRTEGFPATYAPAPTNVADIDVLVARSTDTGRTWPGSDYWIGANGNSPVGTMPCSAPHGKIQQLPNGKLLMSMWAYWRWSTTTEHPKLAYSGYVESTDDGLTWSGLKPIGDYGETAFLLLADSTTLIATAKNPGGEDSLHILRSTDTGTTWQVMTTAMKGKNATLVLSPHNIPIFMGKPSENLPAIGYYTLDNGTTWKRGFHITPVVSDSTLFSYALSATKISSDELIVVYEATDASKPEWGVSEWSSTKSYIGYTVFKEIVE